MLLLLSFALAVRAMACANYSFQSCLFQKEFLKETQLTLGHIHVTFEGKA